MLSLDVTGRSVNGRGHDRSGRTSRMAIRRRGVDGSACKVHHGGATNPRPSKAPKWPHSSDGKKCAINAVNEPFSGFSGVAVVAGHCSPVGRLGACVTNGHCR